MSLQPTVIKPDNAIILGLLKKVLKSIFLKIAQKILEQYFCLTKLVFLSVGNSRRQYV
jgi:hypothetical protein